MDVRIYVDDGHPLDVRVAYLLERYGVKGIFYIAPQNRERPVMDHNAMRDIAKRHEIGGHTLTHQRLTRLSYQEQLTEIKRGKDELEIIINQPIAKFSYPRGWYNEETMRAVKECGLKEARTMKQGIIDLKRYDWEQIKFRLPITFHFYEFNLHQFLPLFEATKKADGYFGMTCHSWEIDKFDLWQEFEDTIKYISNNK